MSLSTYKEKRNFNQTAEPEGKKALGKDDKLVFVIQRHKASRLHYDFRLEMDGVLKSWAVPKGPSLNPHDKRLAMMVEDHPYDYKDFAGTIPEGNYGAGIVEIWDNGTYTALEDKGGAKANEKVLQEGLATGNLKFVLHGKKLKGEFALVKIKNDETNSWLLIKHNDSFATQEEYNSEEDTPANSPINKWLAENKPGKKPVKKKVLTKAIVANTRKLEDYIPAMLAKETDAPFSDKDWLYEIKWDGYRAIAELNGGQVLLYSRNGNSFVDTYPEVVQELAKLEHDIVIDGEIVVLNETGQPDFQKLQHFDTDRSFPILFYVFDLLKMNGNELFEVPLIKRKELLAEIIEDNPVIKYSDHLEEKGKEFFELISEKNMEGIMAKKWDSLYYPGKRSADWLKIKHHKSDEAIIVGYTAPRGERKYFGALVLGTMVNGKLTYAGHTGSGFDTLLLKELYAKLQLLVREKSPFSERVKTNMPVTWVEPKYVCEIKFTEWTSDGKLRHPIFLRLREDKPVAEVNNKIINADKMVAEKTATKQEEAPKATPAKKATAKKVKAAKESQAKENENTSAEKTADGKKGVVNNEKEKTYRIGKAELKTTNRTKVFFPDDSVTKGDVQDYYDQMADLIIPYLKDRPQSLFRTPNGINQKGFFHKDAGDDAPSWVKHIPLYSDSAKKDIDYLLCNDKATLLYLANLGCIEINPWHSRVKSLDNPDYLIIDIDPSDNNTFDQVIEAANVVKGILDQAGAFSICKTSGASGLHIYLPLGAKYDYDHAKDFANLVCMLATQLIPGFTTLERNLSKRSKDKIYMDYLQNRKGQTIACVYSLRPKKGATVSTPLAWSEVKAGLTPKDFNISTIANRIKEKGDLFAPMLDKKNVVNLAKCIENLGG